MVAICFFTVTDNHIVTLYFRVRNSMHNQFNIRILIQSLMHLSISPHSAMCISILGKNLIWKQSFYVNVEKSCWTLLYRVSCG